MVQCDSSDDVIDYQGYYYDHERSILTFVAIKQGSKRHEYNDIFIIHYDIRFPHEPEITKIGTMWHENCVDDFFLYLIEKFDEKDDTDEEIYIKCRWSFSMNKMNIVFYLANKNDSIIKIRDCVDCVLKEDNYVHLDFSLLDEDVDLYDFPADLENDPDNKKYFLQNMWFKDDCQSIILRNPYCGSFIMINEDTKKCTVEKFKLKSKKNKFDSSCDPVFIGSTVFVLGTDEENKKNSVVIFF